MPYQKMAGDEQLTKEEKKRRKAERKEKKKEKKEKKAAKKRKRESTESVQSNNNNNGGGDDQKVAARARINSMASVATHHSVTEDTITEMMGGRASERVISQVAMGTSSSSSSVAGAAAAVTSAGNGAKHKGNGKEPYRLQKVRSLVSLAPSSLSDIKGNIRRLCCEDVTRYVHGLGGVLMAVRKVHAVKQGRVLNELPHIHFEVEAECVTFCPEIGTRLVGVVNESFPSHVGMLVDTLFNAMVPADELRSIGYEYDLETNEWSTQRDMTTGELLESPVVIGSEDRIGFTVTRINEANGIISMDGGDPTIERKYIAEEE